MGQITVPPPASLIKRALMAWRCPTEPLLEVDLLHPFNVGVRHPHCSSFCERPLLRHPAARLMRSRR